MLRENTEHISLLGQHIYIAVTASLLLPDTCYHQESHQEQHEGEGVFSVELAGPTIYLNGLVASTPCVLENRTVLKH